MGRLTFIFLWMLCISSTSWAEDDTARAKALYQEGEQYLKEGQYEKAIEAYQNGYDLSQRPAFLYNIAVVYLRIEDFDQAHSLLVEYRSLAPSSEWADIDKLIKSLVPKLTPQPEKPEKPETPKPVEEPAAPAEPLPNESNRVLSYSLLGTSTALTITGSVLAIKARQIHNQIDDICLDGICEIQAQPLILQEKNFALAADINLAVGIIGLGAGAILLNAQSPSGQWSIHNNMLMFQRSF